jgi:hypothetical protein
MSISTTYWNAEAASVMSLPDWRRRNKRAEWTTSVTVFYFHYDDRKRQQQCYGIEPLREMSLKDFVFQICTCGTSDAVVNAPR